jgi:hypothetical protein
VSAKRAASADASLSLSADETDVKVVLSLPPSPVTTGMIATAIPVAMRPYSIAVAALSSFRNLMMSRMTAAP